MTSEPSHSSFGTPLSEWIAAIPNELKFDAVGLWEMIPGMRESFDLEGPAPDQALREALAGVLARGARPVIGDAEDKLWHEVTRHGDNPADIIDAVIAEWHAMGRDPDVGDVWFALPSFYDNETAGAE